MADVENKGASEREKDLNKSILRFFSKFSGKPLQQKDERETSSLFRGAPHIFALSPKINRLRQMAKGIDLRSVKSKLSRIVSPKRAISKTGLVGLDIGSSSIKLSHIQHRPEDIVLLSYRIEQLPSEGMESSKRAEILQEKLKKLKKEGLLRAPVVCAFTDPNLNIELLRFPRMPSAELDSAVEWAMKEQFSIDLEESVLDFSVIGQREIEGQRQMEILVVVTARETVLDYMGLLGDSGIDVIAIEPAPLAFFESLETERPWKEGEVVGLLDIGAKVTNFDIVATNAVHFTRVLSVAGDSFTQSIADYCMMERPAAEELKKKAGMSRMVLEEDRRVKEVEQDERVKVAHALGLQLEQFMTELDRSFKYFSMELSGSTIQRMDRLLIGGGGGLLKNLGDFLSYRLKIPVVIANPLSGLQVDGANLDKNALQQVASQLCVSIGLALRK